MGIREDFLAKLDAMKLKGVANAAVMKAGRPAKVVTDAELLKGHAKVSADVGFQATVYETRLGGCFGWFWLAFTCVHCVAMFYGLSNGSVKMSGTIVAHATWWHCLGLALFYVPFFLVGFAFTIARYRVELTADLITVRWRILPYLGWTWKLPVGEGVAVTLAFRGSSENKKPVESIVITSLGTETHFGAFLPTDVKEFIAGAIRHYYGEPTAEVISTPFIPND